MMDVLYQLCCNVPVDVLSGMKSLGLKKKQQKKTAFEIMNNELTSFDLILKLDVDERRTLSVQAFN